MKKNKVKNVLPKYAFGTITNPSQDVYENQIAIVKAQQAGENNKWAQGVDMFGNLAIQVGQSMMQSGMANGEGADGKGVAGFLNKNNGSVNSGLNMMSAYSQFKALGGEVTGTSSTPKNYDPLLSKLKPEIPKSTREKKQEKKYKRSTEALASVEDFNINDLPPETLMAFQEYLGQTFFAAGGQVPNLPVEVEGQEVGQTPQGQLLDFQGPSHEDGGIPIALPEGTEIYSKRIKVDGVSMADRKKKREKKTVSLEELFEKNSTDALIKNALGRTKQTNEIEESADQKIQQTVASLLTPQTGLPQHAFDPVVGTESDEDFAKRMLGAYNNNIFQPQLSSEPDAISFPQQMDGADGTLTLNQLEKANPSEKTPGFDYGSLMDNVTLGDAVGLAGNLVSTFGPMKNTKSNRAGDTPNINAFKDYGKEGLKTLDDSKQYINQIRAQKLKDLELARTGSIKRNRNSARGINTIRALDLATDAQVNNQQDETYNSFAQAMMSILGQQAGMENQQDSVVMQGEQGRDLADRQDRDNYYTQLAKDIATKGKGLQETSYDLNKMKERKTTGTALNNLSDYLNIDANGNITVKPGAKLVGNKVVLDNKQDEPTDEELREMYNKSKKKAKK